MSGLPELISRLRAVSPSDRSDVLTTWIEAGGDEQVDEVEWERPGEEVWVEAMELATEEPPSRAAAAFLAQWLRSRMRSFTWKLDQGEVSPVEWRMLALQVRVEWVGPHPHHALMAAAWLQRGPLADAVPHVTGSEAYRRFIGLVPLHHGWAVDGRTVSARLPTGTGAYAHQLASVTAMRDGDGVLLSAQASMVGGSFDFRLCAPDLVGLGTALGRDPEALTGGPFQSAHDHPDDAFGALLAEVRAARVAELTQRFAAAVGRAFESDDSDAMRGIFDHADDSLRLSQATFHRSLAGTYLTNDAWLECVHHLLDGTATVAWNRDAFGANPLGPDGVVFRVHAHGRGFLYLFDAAGRSGQTPMGPV